MKRLTNKTNAPVRATLNSFGIIIKSIALCLTMFTFFISYGQETTFESDVKIVPLDLNLARPTFIFSNPGTGQLSTKSLTTIGNSDLNPNGIFNVHQPNDNNDAFINITNSASNANGGFKIGHVAGIDLVQIRQEENSNMEFYTAGNFGMVLDNSGRLGINGTPPMSVSGTWGATNLTALGTVPFNMATPKLSVNGDIETTFDLYGTRIYLASDERLKLDFNPLNDWHKVLDLNSYSYKFNKEKNKVTSYGYKAQEVYKLIPELTSNWNGVLAVDYIGFIPFLTEGLKEHEAQLKKIELMNSSVNIEKIISLEAENKLLKERLDKLEAKLNTSNNDTKIETDGSIGNKNRIGVLKDRPILEQNEPNPFTEKTEINYFLPEGNTNASIIVKTNDGNIVGDFPLNSIGFGSITINPGTLSAGTYYYSLISNNNVIDTKKMTLLK